MAKLVYQITGVWLFLFGICLPYPIHLLGLEKGLLFGLLEPFLNWMKFLLFDSALAIETAYSDGLMLYILFTLLLVLSIPITLLIRNIEKIKYEYITQFFHKAIAYLLAFFLFKYGMDKFLGNQFPLPEGNLLFTPLKDFSKDILFWTSMSSSKIYLNFMAIIEVIPAILLLFPKSRKLGVIISLGVLSNILFVNIGFDISVKLVSFYLFICSVFLLSFYWVELKSFFTNQTIHKFREEINLLHNPKLNVVVSTVLVLLLFYEGIRPHLQFNSSRDSLYQSYTVIESNTTLLQIEDIKRVHIHSDQYLILEDRNNNFYDFKFKKGYDKASNSPYLLLEKENKKLYYSLSLNSFVLRENKKQKEIHLELLNLKSQPFFKDNFHLTIESYFN